MVMLCISKNRIIKQGRFRDWEKYFLKNMAILLSQGCWAQQNTGTLPNFIVHSKSTLSPLIHSKSIKDYRRHMRGMEGDINVTHVSRNIKFKISSPLKCRFPLYPLSSLLCTLRYYLDNYFLAACGVHALSFLSVWLFLWSTLKITPTLDVSFCKAKRQEKKGISYLKDLTTFKYKVLVLKG